MTEGRLFFELAATLIPVLLFGTALMSLRPEFVLRRVSSRRNRVALLIAVTAFVCLALAAEVFAIELSVSTSGSGPLPEASRFKTLVVVQTLILGVAILGGAVLLPWYEALRISGLLPGIVAVGYGVLVLVGASVLTRSAYEADYGRGVCRSNALAALGEEIAADIAQHNELLARIAELELDLRQVLRNERIPLKERQARARLLRSRRVYTKIQADQVLSFSTLKTKRLTDILEGAPVPGC